MALGFHFFHAANIHYLKTTARHEGDYFIGGFVGDDFKDEAFASRINKIKELLRKKYGSNIGWSYNWAPVNEKETFTLTAQQKFNRMKTMAYNKYKKLCGDIIKGNSLFVADELAEAKEKYDSRIVQLQLRYFVNYDSKKFVNS